jgi:hypothetical protein
MGPHNFGGGEARPLSSARKVADFSDKADAKKNASTPPKKPDSRRIEVDDREAEKRRTARNSKTGPPRGRTRG